MSRAVKLLSPVKAVAFAASGAAIAWQADHLGGGLFAVVMAGSVVAGAGGLALAGRAGVEPSRP